MPCELEAAIASLEHEQSFRFSRIEHDAQEGQLFRVGSRPRVE